MRDSDQHQCCTQQLRAARAAAAAATPARCCCPASPRCHARRTAAGLFIGGITSLDHLQQLHITHVVVSGPCRPAAAATDLLVMDRTACAGPTPVAHRLFYCLSLLLQQACLSAAVP